jgi:hypothetical protein
VRRGLVAVALLVALALAPAARAATPVDRAVEALRNDPVYVDPAAGTLSVDGATAVRKEIAARGAAPMYVAVLPDDGSGSAQRALEGIVSGLGRDGSYVVAVGHHLSAHATNGNVGSAMNAAIAAHKRDGLEAILLDFTDRVGSGSGSGGGSGGPGAVILLGLAAVGGGALLVARRRRRERERAEFAEVKENARDDLVALGDDIRALDLDVEMPGTDPDARAAYGQAVDAYDRANGQWERATEPRDLEPVGAALEEGRYAMTAAKARMDGRPVPERRPPCFFDPRHGPSARDVEWAPDGGTPRPVPACEADAQRVERGEDPEAREVLIGGRRMPYWAAGPMYAPFAGGFFGGFGGGLLPGLLIGEMLGGAMYPGPAWGGDGGDSGGDFGGGDFGGGDFGGGDF